MRLSDLLGATVLTSDDVSLGQVADVRLAQVGPVRGAQAQFVVESLYVSPHHAGSLLGYSRRRHQGPWLIGTLVRQWHRHAVRVHWDDVVDVDTAARVVRLRADVEPVPWHDEERLPTSSGYV